MSKIRTQEKNKTHSELFTWLNPWRILGLKINRTSVVQQTDDLGV